MRWTDMIAVNDVVRSTYDKSVDKVHANLIDDVAGQIDPKTCIFCGEHVYTPVCNTCGDFA